MIFLIFCMVSRFTKMFQDKKVLILGLGAYAKGSGVEAAKFLNAHGAEVVVCDKKSKKELAVNVSALKKYPDITFVLNNKLVRLDGIRFLFQNPGVPDTHPLIVSARKKHIPIINDWTLFFMHPNARCVGVTGTRGKTTTTMLLYQMIKKKYKNAKLAGNIGVSPLSFLDRYNGQVVVAEFSSWLLRGLRATKKGPHIGVVTNIMRDHMNAYPSMREYIQDKEMIFAHQNSGDTTVLNYDDPITRGMAKKTKGKVFWFGATVPPRNDSTTMAAGMVVLKKKGREKKIVSIDTLRIMGMHNVMNVLAATAAASVVGVSNKDIAITIKNFNGVPNRLEKIKTWHGIALYNDTTATSPDATIAALHALSSQGNIILLCGGADKKLAYVKWGKAVAEHAKTVVLLSGDATSKMKKELHVKNIAYTEHATLNSAFKEALSSASSGDILLFSPGAASFNMFKNEFDRGDQFCALVQSL